MDPTKKLERSWHKLLNACIEEARSRGAVDPQIYVESESGIVVTDGDSHDERTGNPRRDRILFELSWPAELRGRLDVGAW